MAIVAAILWSCGHKPSENCPINPLYKSLDHYDKLSQAQRDSLWLEDSTEIKAMFEVMHRGEPTQEMLEEWASSAVNEIFTPTVDSVFPTLEPVERALGAILKNAQDAQLKIGVNKYTAVVWGNSKSIVFADSCMLIALNHYLGADYPGYEHWPQYLVSGKTPERLPYDMAEALVATAYPYQPATDATALNRMLYEGAIILAKLQLVADAELSEALGYDAEQLQWLESNQKHIWQTMVTRDLLYDTSEITAERLVDPSPATTLIHQDAPGRTGRYIGYQIAKKYMDATGTSLLEMLSPTFYNNPQALIKANYQGE